MPISPTASSPARLLVVSARTPGATPRSLAGLEAVGEMGMASHFRRGISGPEDVGFYSNGFGYLPWTWRNGPIERFTVWRVHAATPAPGIPGSGAATSARAPRRHVAGTSPSAPRR